MSSFKSTFLNQYGVDTRIQDIALNLLLEFHHFCEKNDLVYYIHAGTVLGAVRHKGFIPWDDDIDVIMPREDYEKLLLIANQFKNPYFLASYKTIIDGTYPYQWAKLEDSRTKIIEKLFPNGRANAGIFIDIFPLDSFPDKERKRKKIVKKSIKWKIYLLAYYDYYDPRKYLRWFWKIIKFFLHMSNKGNELHKKADKAMIKNYKSNFSGDIFGWDMQGVMPATWYGTPIQYVFEGYSVWGPAEPEKYLRNAYGEYLILPKPEKRMATHGYTFKIPKKIFLEHINKTIEGT